VTVHGNYYLAFGDVAKEEVMKQKVPPLPETGKPELPGRP